MNVDLGDAAKAGLASLVAVLFGWVRWLHKTVVDNRERALLHDQRVKQIELEVKTLKDSLVSKEDIRDVIHHALSQRDVHNADRRISWEENLTLRIRQAVMEGVSECQAQTRKEIERLVPTLVREVLTQTDKHRTLRKEG